MPGPIWRWLLHETGIIIILPVKHLCACVRGFVCVMVGLCVYMYVCVLAYICVKVCMCVNVCFFMCMVVYAYQKHKIIHLTNPNPFTTKLIFKSIICFCLFVRRTYLLSFYNDIILTIKHKGYNCVDDWFAEINEYLNSIPLGWIFIKLGRCVGN